MRDGAYGGEGGVWAAHVVCDGIGSSRRHCGIEISVVTVEKARLFGLKKNRFLGVYSILFEEKLFFKVGRSMDFGLKMRTRIGSQQLKYSHF